MVDLAGMYDDSPIIAYWKTRKDGVMQIRKPVENGERHGGWKYPHRSGLDLMDRELAERVGRPV